MDHSAVALRLPCTGPLDWPALLGFFRARTVDGIEAVERGTYRRTVRHGNAAGTVEVAPDPAGNGLSATLRLSGGVPTDAIIGRLRRLFDLDADLDVINAHLARDPTLAPLVAARPALRVPGNWDGFELALRAVIGQQVSVAAARRLNGRLAERCGVMLADGGEGPLHRLFPTPEEVLAANLSAMGMPGARVATLKALAEAALADPRLFERGATVEETVAKLRSVKGIGDWTAHYIALRACREPDAFPAGDVGLLRAMAGADGRRPGPRELLARAEAWRPWRAYAAQHLWTADPAGR